MADAPEEFLNQRESELDTKPLQFGKFKGKTPEEVSELPDKDRRYLVWAWETVGNGDVCSHALYRECGGTMGKEGRAKVDKHKPDYRTFKPEQMEMDLPPSDTYESKRSSPATRHPFVDDLDDDIPF